MGEGGLKYVTPVEDIRYVAVVMILKENEQEYFYVSIKEATSGMLNSDER